MQALQYDPYGNSKKKSLKHTYDGHSATDLPPKMKVSQSLVNLSTDYLSSLIR